MVGAVGWQQKRVAQMAVMFTTKFPLGNETKGECVI
jgi:hypothetical protein